MTEPAGGPDALVLMACSRRKAAGRAEGRAWDVYDGRLFQVLKKALRASPWWPDRVRILIVSARYGILSPEDRITAYDQRLTTTTAREWRGAVAEALRHIASAHKYRSVHINLGRAYREALPDLRSLFAGAVLDWASGGIGRRNAQTRRWVLRELSLPPI
jgi:hypothetical protein